MPPDPLPDTVAGWRAAADLLLSPQCCAFHRNMEISARYAWLHGQLPSSFKWAGMAAIASHHVRWVLFPFRLDADRSGYVDLPRSMSRRRLLTQDANTMREVNNAIYDDIYWVHLAYLWADDGIECLRRLMLPHPEHAELLAAFETIDRGRAVLADPEAGDHSRRIAADLVWAGNLALLAHEQRVVVQPLFDRLSGTFGRLASMGSTTTFEVQGLRQEVRYFTSFSAYWLTAGLAAALRARAVPRVTRFEDRWSWLEASVVPRFRRFDDDAALIALTLDRVSGDAQRVAASPCLIPVSPESQGSPLAADLPISRPAVSKHLRVLADAGLVVAQDLGRERHYRLRPAALRPVQAFLAEVTAAGARPPVTPAMLDALDLEVRRVGRDREPADHDTQHAHPRETA